MVEPSSAVSCGSGMSMQWPGNGSDRSNAGGSGGKKTLYLKPNHKPETRNTLKPCTPKALSLADPEPR